MSSEDTIWWSDDPDAVPPGEREGYDERVGNWVPPIEHDPLAGLNVDEAFAAIITEEYKHGEPEVDPKDVRIPARLRATYYMVEGLSHLAHNFDIEDELVAFLGGGDDARGAVLNPAGYIRYKTEDQGFISVLDLLVAWETTGLATEMAKGIATWMDEHRLEHLTAWVYLTGIGFMPLHIHAEGNVVTLPLPTATLSDPDD